MPRLSRALKIRAGIIIAMLLFGTFTLFWARHAIVGTFNANDAAKAQMLATKPWARQPAVFPELFAPDANHYAQIRDRSGQTIWRSPSLGIANLPNPPTYGRITDFKLPNGQSGHAVCVECLSEDGQQLLAVFAEPASEFWSVWCKSISILLVIGLGPLVILTLLYPARNTRA